MDAWRNETRERWRQMKWLAIPTLGVAIALMVAGAIAGNSDDKPPVGSGESAAATGGAKPRHQQQLVPDRSPAVIAEQVARDVCANTTVAEMAAEFGVPADEVAVIEAYGEGSTEAVRPASERGCLEGLNE